MNKLTLKELAKTGKIISATEKEIVIKHGKFIYVTYTKKENSYIPSRSQIKFRRG